MTIAFITGASGYIGSNLSKALLAKGWQVHALLRPESSPALLPEHASLQLSRHHGGTEELTEILGRACPDIVFHLASTVVSQHSAADVLPLIHTNLAFSTQLLEAMSAHGVTRLVNTGTYWQHFNGASYSPVNLYAASKQAFEVMLQFYVEAVGFDAITLKLFDAYGPNDPRPKLFHLLSRAQNQVETLDLSPGEQLLDFVHISDVVGAYVHAANSLLGREQSGHSRYAVATDQPRRLRDVVALFERVSGKPVPIRWGGRPYRSREMMVPSCTDPLLPGWRACVDLEQGLTDLIQAAA